MWQFLDFAIRFLLIAGIFTLGRIFWRDVQREWDQKHGK